VIETGCRSCGNDENGISKTVIVTSSSTNEKITNAGTDAEVTNTNAGTDEELTNVGTDEEAASTCRTRFVLK